MNTKILMSIIAFVSLSMGVLIAQESLLGKVSYDEVVGGCAMTPCFLSYSRGSLDFARCEKDQKWNCYQSCLSNNNFNGSFCVERFLQAKSADEAYKKALSGK